MARDYRHPKQQWKKAVVKSTIGNKMYLCSTDDGEWRRHANQIISHKNAKTVISPPEFYNDHFMYSDRFSISNATQTTADVEPDATADTNDESQSEEYFSDEYSDEDDAPETPVQTPETNDPPIIAIPVENNGSEVVVTRAGRTSKKPERLNYSK